MNVLVVDDGKFSSLQIIQALHRMGMENFHQAADEKEAIAIIENKYFDLIITDYDSPEIDGRNSSMISATRLVSLLCRF